jgi:hypothetical protein
MGQKLEIEDFSGGVTDYYLNAPPNKLKTCDNLLLIQYPTSAKPFTRPGSGFYISAASAQLPTGAQRVSTMKFVATYPLFQSSQKLYRNNAGSFTEVASPVGNAFRLATTNSIFSVSEPWQHQTIWTHSDYMQPMRVRHTGSGGFSAESAGAPKPTINSTSVTAGANNWLYRIVRTYTYTTADGITFLDRSAPSDIRTALSAATPVTVNWTAYTNSADASFPTTMGMEIYRTTNAGTTFYLVGSTTDAAATFVDNVSDATLINNEVLYTAGGVVPNDIPPRCSLTHVFGDVAYYADVYDGTSNYRFRLMHSVPGSLFAVPSTFFLDLDNDITGISSTKSNVVCLCRSGAVYRIDGVFDELGRGGMFYERISDTADCISGQSVVQALDGLFWAGRDGIFFTDGYQVVKLNGDYDKTWSSWVDTTQKQQRIQGKYDKRKNRIWWTIQGNVTDVDRCYVLDLTYGIRENATFTTVSGMDSFSPTAIDFDVNGDLIRCDRRGYVFKHSNTLFTDLKVDVNESPADWVRQTIFYNLESIAFNFGTSVLRKYVTGINVVADSITNLALQITSNNDDAKSLSDLLPIRYRGNVVWGEPDIYWGDPTIAWNLEGLILEKRRMPAKNLRCSYKIVGFTNAYVVIITSDLLGTADIDATSKTVTLSDTAAYDWPSDSVDWYISFEADNFDREYLITARTDDVLTYEDSINASSNVIGSRWQISGYPKGEILNLLNYALYYDIFGQTQEVFNKSDTGSIAT